MTVGSIIGEPLGIHRIAKGAEKEERVASLLEKVGLRAEDMRKSATRVSAVANGSASVLRVRSH